MQDAALTRAEFNLLGSCDGTGDPEILPEGEEDGCSFDKGRM